MNKIARSFYDLNIYKSDYKDDLEYCDNHKHISESKDIMFDEFGKTVYLHFPTLHIRLGYYIDESLRSIVIYSDIPFLNGVYFD